MCHFKMLNFGICKPSFDSLVGDIPRRREWQPTPVFLPGEFRGQRSLAGYSSWGRKESDMTEQLNTHRHSQKEYKKDF